jgi:hypothetical protein
LSRITAVLQAELFPLSLPHFRSIGGKYTGLAFSNFTFSTLLFELTPKLVYIRYESAPVLRVALSSKFRKVVFTTS